MTSQLQITSRWRTRLRRAAPWLTLAALLAAWQAAVVLHPRSLIPGPWPVLLGVVELAKKGLLFKYVLASLFRVTWGYLLAIALAIPCGLMLGWYRHCEYAFAPLLQLFRPISPLAWIPISIL